MRALVIDDDPLMRRIVAAAIRRHRPADVEVVDETEDALSGIALAIVHQPELVVLDQMMPEMAGLDALPRLRAAAPSARIILYTGSPDRSLRRQALDHGAAGVVTKAEPLDSLLSEVDRVVVDL